MTVKTMSSTQSFSHYLDIFIADGEYRKVKSTKNGEQPRINRLRKIFGEEDLRSIKHSTLRMTIAGWHSHLKNKTINEHLTILRFVFSTGLADQILDHNPMENIKNLLVEKTEPDPFTKIEIARLSNCNDVCPQVKNATALDILTGLRISELIALCWDDVDWKNKKLYVRRACVLDVYKCPKTTDSVRDVDLNPLAISILKSQLKLMGKRRSKTVNVLQRDNKTLKQESLNFIFVNTKTNQPFTDAKEFTERFFKNYLIAAGVRHRGVGQLRHTFASQCLTAGINKEWLAHQMGHSDTKMIDRYYGKWIREDSFDCSLQAARHLQDSFGLLIPDRDIKLPSATKLALDASQKFQAPQQQESVMESAR
ncbi:tyrosine-type recombinase/integrase [Vibrio mimicus]|uniref:tyrosine-type recombinase/integrase n=1 Tax=Vibrio mimicus TaxID=674 RepID=UPI0001BADB43|nr:site-specific integrase [Vibrio mimicus]EEY44535.1 putative pore-forming cytotoxin integrase [Vibrio mimicus VM223]